MLNLRMLTDVVVPIFYAFYLLNAYHGGSTNAFTSSEHTDYYFDVNTNGFEEALDRQILFFIFLLPVILITALRNVTLECLLFFCFLFFLFFVVVVVQICSVLY